MTEGRAFCSVWFRLVILDCIILYNIYMLLRTSMIIFNIQKASHFPQLICLVYKSCVVFKLMYSFSPSFPVKTLCD